MATSSYSDPKIPGIKSWKYENKSCSIQFEVPSEIPGPVYFYYRLTEFYQNNRRYVKSFDLNQLSGSTDLRSDTNCAPIDTVGNSKVNESQILVNGTLENVSPSAVYYPCGLIANSLFSGLNS